MLPRPGPAPSGAGWSFELKWDGFRALVSTEDDRHVRSRRDRNRTGVLPQLRRLASGLVLGGVGLCGARAGNPPSPMEFKAKLALARGLRARVDALPDGLEIVGAVRAELQPGAHPPEPPPRHGELITEILELLDDPALSADQVLELQRTFLRTDEYASVPRRRG